MDKTENKMGHRLCARYDNLWASQGSFRSLWQDAADYIMPRKGNIETIVSSGESQTRQIFDSSPGEYAQVFAAGMVSQLTPAGQIWARYAAPEGAPSEEKAWMDKCTRIAMRIIHASNFYEGWHEEETDAGIFGSSLMLTDAGKDGENPINVIHIPVGTFVWAEGSNGRVDQIYRHFEWTAHQIVEKWPDAALPDDLVEAVDSDPSKKWKVIHGVYPRKKKDVMEGETIGSKRPWASDYVLHEGKVELEEDGYYDWPYSAGRLFKSNGETYGRGPGIQAEPEIKMVNRIRKSMLIGLEKMVSPGWLMPEDSSFVPDNRADGITYWDSSDPNNKPEQVQLNNRVDLARVEIEDVRGGISRAFFNPMFQMLTTNVEQKREKTAFEVAQMVQEKLVLFSPIFSRTVQEKLNPFMNRVFMLLYRGGHFPDPPQSIIDAGGVYEYKIEYVSKIALAIKAAINNSLAMLIELVGAVAEFDESAPHVVNWRKAMRDVSENHGIPDEWIRDDEEIDGIMNSIREANAQAAAPEQAEQMASAAQKLGPKAQQKVAAQL